MTMAPVIPMSAEILGFRCTRLHARTASGSLSAMCLGLCPSNRFMRAFSTAREIRPARAAGRIDPLLNKRFSKEEQVSMTLILVGAAGMAASILIASRLNSGWLLTWLFFAFVLGFGIGVRGKA